MRSPVPAALHFAVFLVGTVGPLVPRSLLFESCAASDVRQAPRVPGSPPENDVVAPKIPQCGAPEQRTEQKPLTLDATPGVPLQFQCGESQTLRPEQVANKFTEVYKYTAVGACKTDEAVMLTDQVPEATLTTVALQGGLDQAAVQTYQFAYNTAPEAEKLLCYTCNGAGAGRLGTPAGSGTEQCTVYIKVPKETTGSATNPTTSPTSESTTSPTTASPSTETSEARAIPASFAIASAAVLGVMLLT